MRKRSGAFHSDSQEQFRMLAELSESHLGFYYDEKVNKEIKAKLAHQIIPPSKEDSIEPLLSGFQFTQQQQLQKQEREELWASTHCSYTNIVLICNQNARMKSIIFEIWPQQKGQREKIEQQERSLDFCMIKRQGLIQNAYVKFWMIQRCKIGEIMYQTYLNRAEHAYNFCDSQQQFIWIQNLMIQNRYWDCCKQILLSVVSSSHC